MKGLLDTRTADQKSCYNKPILDQDKYRSTKGTENICDKMMAWKKEKSITNLIFFWNCRRPY